jgi:hypothetical protein
MAMVPLCCGVALLVAPPVLLLASNPLLLPVADDRTAGGLAQVQLPPILATITVMSSRLPRCLRAQEAKARAAMPAALQPAQMPLLKGCFATCSSTFFTALRA